MQKFYVLFILLSLTAGIGNASAQELSLECRVEENWKAKNTAGYIVQDNWLKYIAHIELSNEKYLIQRDDSGYSWQGTFSTYPSKYVLMSSEPKPQPPLQEISRESYIDRIEARYYSYYVVDTGNSILTIVSQGNCRPTSAQIPQF